MTKSVFGISNRTSAARQYTGDQLLASVQQPDDAIGLMDGWALIKRRAKFIASIVIVFTSLAALVSFTVSKTFTASSAVVLERKDIRPFATDAHRGIIDVHRSLYQRINRGRH